MSINIETRLAIHDLYGAYAQCLDDLEIDVWPDFFVDDCFYQIIPRENFERDLPLAIFRCESKGMLQDRVNAINETMMFEPRYIRHMQTITSVQEGEGGRINVRMNFAVLETLADEFTKVLIAGSTRDELIETEQGLKFVTRHCVYDSELVPNSVIYPV